MKKLLFMSLSTGLLISVMVGAFALAQWTLSPSGSSTVSNCQPTATVTVGSVTGLFPGASGTANLSVANTSSCISPGIAFDYDAASVALTLVSGDGINCPDANFSAVYNFVDDTTNDHPATSTSHVDQSETDVDTVTVSLSSTAPDGCQGVAAALTAVVTLTQD